MHKILVLGLVLGLGFLTAAPASHAGTSARNDRKWSVALGGLTSPMPSVIGINGSYAFWSWMKLTLGAGSIKGQKNGAAITVSTANLDLKFYHPNWNLSPFIVIGSSRVTGTVAATSGPLKKLGELSAGVSFGVSGIGLEWQTAGGFLIGIESKTLIYDDKDLIALPGLYAGWSF